MFLGKNVSGALRNPVLQVTIANLASVGLGTVSGVLTARGLGPEGRGSWAVVMAFFTVALIVAEIGQSGAVTFFVARDPHRRREVVRRARRIMLVGGLLVAAAGIIAAPQLAGGVHEVEDAYRLASLGIIINSLFAAKLFAMQARDIRRWNVARVAQPFFYAVGVAMMLVLGEVSVRGVAIALVASTSLQFIVLGLLGLNLSTRSDGLSPARSVRVDVDLAGQSAGDRPDHVSQGVYGMRYSAAAVPTVLAAQYDKIALSRLVSSPEVGFYAVGSTVALLVAPFSAAIANVIFPRASKRELGWRERRNVESKTIVHVCAVSLLVSAALCASAPLAVPFFFGSAFTASVPVVWALAAVMVARSVSQVAGALIRARGLPGAAAVAQITGLVLGAALMLPAVSSVGLLGAAVALGVGESATLTILLISLSRMQRSDRRLSVVIDA